MPIDPELLELMTSDVMIASRTAENVHGEATYAPDRIYKGRIVRRNRRVRTAAGEEKISTMTVFMGTGETIDPLDRITLPDGSRPVILSVESFPDESGEYYVAVFT